MADLDRQNPLFDRSLPVQVQGSLHDPDLRSSNLVFRILHGTQPSSVPGQVDKLYHFEITDERDPYFLYYFDVTEADFSAFKRDQSIVVDFHVFPRKMIELFDLCLRSVSGPLTIASEDATLFFEHAQSSYLCKLDLETCVFSVVEANKFKYITHITLPLRLGDDSAIKMYLASRLTLSLEIASTQQASITTLQSSLETLQKETQELQAQLQHAQTNFQLQTQQLVATHTSEANALQGRHLQQTEAMRGRYEAQLDDLKLAAEHSELQAAKSDLQGRIHGLESDVSALSLEKTSLSLKLQDTLSRLELTTQDNQAHMGQCSALTEQLRALESETGKLRGERDGLVGERDTLRGILGEREERLRGYEQMLALLQDQKRALEERLSALSGELEVARGDAKGLESEVSRRDGDLAELRAEASRLRDKLKLKNEVIRREDALVSSLRVELVERDKLLREKDEDAKLVREALGREGERVRALEERLKESSAQIEENRQVIAHLTQEIHEWHLGGRALATPLSPPPAANPLASASPGTPSLYTGGALPRTTLHTTTPHTTPHTTAPHTTSTSGKHTTTPASSTTQNKLSTLAYAPPTAVKSYESADAQGTKVEDIMRKYNPQYDNPLHFLDSAGASTSKSKFSNLAHRKLEEEYAELLRDLPPSPPESSLESLGAAGGVGAVGGAGGMELDDLPYYRIVDVGAGNKGQK
eukprot:gene32505-39300_t